MKVCVRNAGFCALLLAACRIYIHIYNTSHNARSWVAGMTCMVTFYVITQWTCTLLTDCYHVKGKRHTRYKWAVLHVMVRSQCCWLPVLYAECVHGLQRPIRYK